MLLIEPIPAFSDNYIWAITSGNRSYVVDPGDPTVVEQYLQQNNRTLAGILITHHHWDHTDGVAELVEHYQVDVYGPAQSPFTGITQPLTSGQAVELFGHSFTVKDVPGHTLDHISYFSQSNEQPILFCGDTLFLAGCGRLFEGTPAQMQQAMEYFRKLPENTAVYCTHEYSLSNLAFAAAVEPESTAIRQSIQRCEDARKQTDQRYQPALVTRNRLTLLCVLTSQQSARPQPTISPTQTPQILPLY